MLSNFFNKKHNKKSGSRSTNENHNSQYGRPTLKDVLGSIDAANYIMGLKNKDTIQSMITEKLQLISDLSKLSTLAEASKVNVKITALDEKIRGCEQDMSNEWYKERKLNIKKYEQRLCKNELGRLILEPSSYVIECLGSHKTISRTDQESVLKHMSIDQSFLDEVFKNDKARHNMQRILSTELVITAVIELPILKKYINSLVTNVDALRISLAGCLKQPIPSIIEILDYCMEESVDIKALGCSAVMAARDGLTYDSVVSMRHMVSSITGFSSIFSHCVGLIYPEVVKTQGHRNIHGDEMLIPVTLKLFSHMLYCSIETINSGVEGGYDEYKQCIARDIGLIFQLCSDVIVCSDDKKSSKGIRKFSLNIAKNCLFVVTEIIEGLAYIDKYCIRDHFKGTDVMENNMRIIGLGSRAHHPHSLGYCMLSKFIDKIKGCENQSRVISKECGRDDEKLIDAVSKYISTAVDGITGLDKRLLNAIKDVVHVNEDLSQGVVDNVNERLEQGVKVSVNSKSRDSDQGCGLQQSSASASHVKDLEHSREASGSASAPTR